MDATSLTHKLLSVVTAAVCLLALSCGQQEYDVDKISPDRTYRARIEVRARPPKGTRNYTEHVKVQFFRGGEIIHTYEGEESDEYEPSFQDLHPVVEWVDDKTFRMGEDRSNQPFYDELIVSNNTDQHLKYVSVSYAKDESFETLDLAPRSQVTLLASPGFKADGAVSNYSLGYGGMTEGGKQVHGAVEGRKRKSPSDGPLKLQVTINDNDLQ